MLSSLLLAGRAGVASERAYPSLGTAATAGLNTPSMTCSARSSQKALEVVVE
jgi:hypothetical protein